MEETIDMVIKYRKINEGVDIWSIATRDHAAQVRRAKQA
jgi:hypothetical protein